MSIQGFLNDLVKTLQSGPVTLSSSSLPQLMTCKEELEHLESFDLRSFGDALYDGVYIADGSGTTLYVNKAYTEMTGIHPEDVLGKNVAELEGIYYNNAVSLEVIRKKEVVSSIAQSLVNGSQMLVTGAPIFNERGEVSRVVVNNRDIQGLWSMEQALQQTKRKLATVQEQKQQRDLEIEYLRKQSLAVHITGESDAMNSLEKQIQIAAGVDVDVLIMGETGVGKELTANAVYERSARNGGPFIKVNCGAIPQELFESEFFGYEKGAFTGASEKGRIGFFELAEKGVLLLDEIGELPLNMQSKLLRVLQSREITRIGGKKSIPLNVRIIAATNKNLEELARTEHFREDLYYRLNILPLSIPPLRERGDDVWLLAIHFFNKLCKKYGKHIKIEPGVRGLLKGYAWPGNIRELKNIFERLVIITENGGCLTREHFQSLLHISNGLSLEDEGFYRLVENYERKIFLDALSQYHTTREMASALKISQSTVVKKLRKLNLERKDKEVDSI